MLNKVSFLIIVIVISVMSFRVVSQESVPLKLKGEEGRWFSRLMANQIQRDLLELELLRKKIVPALELQLGVKTKRIEELMIAVEATTSALDISKKATDDVKNEMSELSVRLSVSEEEVLSMRAQRNKWYSSPFFYGSVGVAVVLIVEIAAWAAFK